MNKKIFLVATIIIASLVFSSCGGAAPTEEGGTGAEQAGLSEPHLSFATASEDAQDLLLVYATSELFFPEVGFDGPGDIIVTRDTLPALVSGNVWVVQEDTSTVWAAMDEGSVDLVMIGLDKDNEERILSVAPHIGSLENLVPGSVISGGAVGEYDEIVLRDIIEELGLNPDEMQIVAMGGGADARMEAMLAGQLDAGIQQPRNIGPIERAGGAVVYHQSASLPQEGYFVEREFLNEHRDSVCAFILARIMGKQWGYEGADHTANLAQAQEIALEHGVEPSEDELAGWAHELEGNLSMDAGTDLEGLDKFNADLQELGVLSEGFNWRDHADFSCVWEAQEALGLPLRPEKYE